MNGRYIFQIKKANIICFFKKEDFTDKNGQEKFKKPIKKRGF